MACQYSHSFFLPPAHPRGRRLKGTATLNSPIGTERERNTNHSNADMAGIEHGNMISSHYLFTDTI